MAKRGHKLQEFVAHVLDVKCLNIGKKSCRVFVTGGEDRKVNLWAIGKPNALLSLSGHTSPVESVTFDSSEAMVLAGASSGTMKLWDLEDAKVVRTFAGHRLKCSSLEFHPFGEFFASGSADADLKIWDIRKKGHIHTYKGHTSGITTIRFTPDGRWLVSGGEDNIVKLWDLTAGKLLHDFKVHNGAVRSIDFHPNEFLLATGSADKTVKFWDLETFELIGSAGPEVTGVHSMIFHPDGKTLFCGLDRTLKVFSWEPIRCHDDVDIGWSALGDLSIYEGRLLGCSYYGSSVEVWVVDLSLIGPYAAGGFSRSNNSIGSAFKTGASGIFNPFPASLNASDDQKIDTKEIIHTESHDYNSDDLSQKSFRASSTKASKGNQKLSALSKGCKDVSSYLGSRTDTSSISKTSVSSLTSSKDSDTTEKKPGTSKINGSIFLPKGTSINSTGLSGISLSNSKKDSTVDRRRGINVQPANKTICTPVVVMRDTPDPPKSKLYNKTFLPEMEGIDARICKPSHTQKSSFIDIGMENQLLSAELGSSKRVSGDLVDAMVPKNHPGSAVDGLYNSNEGNHGNIKSTTETFQRVLFLDPSFDPRNETADKGSCSQNPETPPINNEKDFDSPCCATAENPVKYVKGVAVQHGRTRSLVESWEKRDKFSTNCSTAADLSPSPTPETIHPCLSSKGQTQHSEREMTSEDDNIANSLMQSRDLFVNVLKSRLTKLQMVRHYWEQNGIKGAISSVAKLPDLPVQADVISVLMEKTSLLSLDFFSCLLPILRGMLSSKIERHIDISLEMLLKLVKTFWPVVRSSISGYSPVGVDIEAEQRINRCRQIFSHSEKIKEILPSLIRRGGFIGRRSLELNLALDG